MNDRQPRDTPPRVSLRESVTAPHTGSTAAPRKSRRDPRRIYLMAPASWKSARSAVHAEAVDWSTMAPAPTQWTGNCPLPARVPTLALRGRSLDALRLSAASRVDGLHASTLAALSQLNLAAARPTARAVQWLAWEQTNRRRAVTAASVCAVFGATAVLLGMGVAHSQPKPANPSVPAAPVVWQQPAESMATAVVVAAPSAEAVAPAPAQPSSAPDVPVETSTPSTLLSDVSTMDLMMPIAEPDLDIASQQSLWAQVGKDSGVDPLLLYSVALVESRSLLPGGEVAPTPWLFRVNDHLILGERHHVQLEMAVASQLGSVVQDVGIMQVYYPMHRDAVRDPLTLLDPRTNISVAAKILREGMHETRDPVLGVGYYHSHTPDLARNYGTAVMTVYQRLKTIYHPGRATRVVAR
jgi:soluble lytic murein transglycosylase-like protein